MSKLTFWVNHKTNKLIVGSIDKNDPQLPITRDITGLMVNGVAEVMIKGKTPELIVTNGGSRYSLKLTKIADI